MSYEIGYRKPPKDNQFKKGSSGNPKGRPKGSKNFVTLLDKELAQTIVVTENGKKKKLSRMQAMVKRIVAGALQGDQRSLLTLVEIMRKTGSFERVEAAESLLPDDYQSILDEYVATRREASTNRTRSSKDES